MKQCCLCGKSGHESSECWWNREVPMSKIGHATFTVRDEVAHSIKETNMCHCIGCNLRRYGHESSECTWHRAVPMSKVGRSNFTVVNSVIWVKYAKVRAEPWFKSIKS